MNNHGFKKSQAKLPVRVGVRARVKAVCGHDQVGQARLLQANNWFGLVGSQVQSAAPVELLFVP